MKARKIFALAAVAAGLVIGAFSAQAAEDLEDIRRDIRYLRSRLDAMESESSPSDLRAYWKSGLRLDSADGAFKLKMGGRMMVDHWWRSEDDDLGLVTGDLQDGAEFRRLRLYTEGTIYDEYDFKVQVDFANIAAVFRPVQTRQPAVGPDRTENGYLVVVTGALKRRIALVVRRKSRIARILAPPLHHKQPAEAQQRIGQKRVLAEPLQSLPALRCRQIGCLL